MEFQVNNSPNDARDAAIYWLRNVAFHNAKTVRIELLSEPQPAEPSPAPSGDTFDVLRDTIIKLRHENEKIRADLLAHPPAEWLDEVEDAINREGERTSWQGFGAETSFSVAVRARLTPKPVERVTVGGLTVYLDGECKYSFADGPFSECKKNAERYAAGLRAELEKQ